MLMAGVLMLNAVLTVRAHQANSHKDHGWEQFTDAVIAWLNKHTVGTVFVLWGSYAQKKGACIDKASTSYPYVQSTTLTLLFECKEFSVTVIKIHLLTLKHTLI